MNLQASLYSPGTPSFTKPRNRFRHVILAKVEPSEKSVEITRKLNQEHISVLIKESLLLLSKFV
uniref:Uncharacterized protein n=1 Tax=Nelumbo nucifera TaxID=4432 RepID=A0A822YT08_NELNU|nr:TPA_asm: hypothetical protein HUJ06_006422 [Nelumbo nucifera]